MAVSHNLDINAIVFIDKYVLCLAIPMVMQPHQLWDSQSLSLELIATLFLLHTYHLYTNIEIPSWLHYTSSSKVQEKHCKTEVKLALKMHQLVYYSDSSIHVSCCYQLIYSFWQYLTTELIASYSECFVEEATIRKQSKNKERINSDGARSFMGMNISD